MQQTQAAKIRDQAHIQNQKERNRLRQEGKFTSKKKKVVNVDNEQSTGVA